MRDELMVSTPIGAARVVADLAVRARWTLVLSPIAAARARHPVRMHLHGIASGLRCVVTWQREVESSRMLFGVEVASDFDFASDCVDVDD